MLFNSVIFLFVFLPTLFLLYFIIPERFRNLLLLIYSFVFYGYGEPKLIALMLLIIFVNYGCGLLINSGRRKLGLWMATIISLGALGFFKYANFTYENIYTLLNHLGISLPLKELPAIILPLGISFYIFQTLSYTIDVYRGDVKATKNLVNFATYVSLFPQLVAGPIVRYIDVAQELEHRTTTVDKFSEGILRFIFGLAKKMILANTCATVADQIFDASPDTITTGAAWLGIIAYSLQIYFDFSAYSDMAIGLGKMFGFHFLENFNYPYIAQSVQEFWRRWHISLSTWFRDYLYIPLGGNRVQPIRRYFNLFIVFFATGLWHGASWNFIVWGLFHGLFLVIERIGFSKILARLWQPLRHVYTLTIVLVGWVLFRASDLSAALAYLKIMLAVPDASNYPVLSASYFFNNERISIGLLSLLFCLPVFPYLQQRYDRLIQRNDKWLIPYYSAALLLLVLVMSYLAVGTYNPFIYFRF